MSGGVLLSHRVAPAVPSALRVLASGFGMCPGVSLALWPPKLVPHPLARRHVVSGWGVWSRCTHWFPGPTFGGWWGWVVVAVLNYEVLGFRLKGTTEWTRAILGHSHGLSMNDLQTCVSVVIVKLSAY